MGRKIRLANRIRRVQRERIERCCRHEIYRQAGSAPSETYMPRRVRRMLEEEQCGLRRKIHLGLVSLASFCCYATQAVVSRHKLRFAREEGREAAEECSPRRQPWVLTKRIDKPRKVERNDGRCVKKVGWVLQRCLSFAPPGLWQRLVLTHGWRRWLHSFSPSRLILSGWGRGNC